MPTPEQNDPLHEANEIPGANHFEFIPDPIEDILDVSNPEDLKIVEASIEALSDDLISDSPIGTAIQATEVDLDVYLRAREKSEANQRIKLFLGRVRSELKEIRS